jgi:hypothetical protein
MYIKVHVISGTRISLPCLLPFLTPCSLAVVYSCGQFQILERPASDAIMQCSSRRPALIMRQAVDQVPTVYHLIMPGCSMTKLARIDPDILISDCRPHVTQLSGNALSWSR